MLDSEHFLVRERDEMGSVQNAIREKLMQGFSPLALEVVDESAKHAGHAGARPGGETHFHVRIVSAVFEGQSRVTRQRQIYALLKDEIAAGVHALSLETLTPDEAAKE